VRTCDSGKHCVRLQKCRFIGARSVCSITHLAPIEQLHRHALDAQVDLRAVVLILGNAMYPSVRQSTTSIRQKSETYHQHNALLHMLPVKNRENQTRYAAEIRNKRKSACFQTHLSPSQKMSMSTSHMLLRRWKPVTCPKHDQQEIQTTKRSGDTRGDTRTVRRALEDTHGRAYLAVVVLLHQGVQHAAVLRALYE
jgi:hypothetical protein